MGDMVDIDWKNLRSSAFVAMQRAYAPYSGFPVGAAAVTDRGRIVVGCNVENVSLGLTLCAENVLVGNLISSGGGRLVAVACCDSRGAALMPCGRCRQVLLEHGGADMLIDTGAAEAAGPAALGELLPRAFGPAERAAGRLGNAGPGPVDRESAKSGPAHPGEPL